jgi:hypothetical protein
VTVVQWGAFAGKAAWVDGPFFHELCFSDEKDGRDGGASRELFCFLAA